MFQLCMDILGQSIVDIMKNKYMVVTLMNTEGKTKFLDKLEAIMQSKLQKINRTVPFISFCR